MLYGIKQTLGIGASHTIHNFFNFYNQHGIFRFYLSERNSGGEFPSYGQGLCIRMVLNSDNKVFIHCLIWDDDTINFGYTGGNYELTRTFFSLPYTRLY